MSAILSTKIILKKSVCVGILALSATIHCSSKAIAQEPVRESSATPQGCLFGYPDGTYKGDRPVTRNEFAAGLDACLNQVNQLAPIDRSDLATRADFEVLIQRQRELNEQLRGLNSRVGNQESKF